MAFNWFKRLFKQSSTQSRTQALTQALDSINQTNTHALTHAPEDSIELEKESLHLGLAAGYTGRSIHDINSSLSRIENLMPSKDWLVIQLDEHFRNHESNEQRRFEAVVNALNSMHSISLEAPEPIKTQLLDKITDAETSLGLSNRMKELVQLVRHYGEVNYFELAQKMDLTESGLRSLLAMTIRRTSEIEKFDKDNRKWLRYKQTSSSSTQSRTQAPDLSEQSSSV